LFRDKVAYPVYMTISNIPKEIRCKPSQHAHILLGYLPVVKLKHIKNLALHRHIAVNLFHACMGQILKLLKDPGVHGVAMASGDGVIRHAHPIFAAFVGDYPKQILATGGKMGKCPNCLVSNDKLECYETYPNWNLEKILAALAFAGSDDFLQNCLMARVKLIHHPFWEDLPYINIF
jgi:hypothetical protein